MFLEQEKDIMIKDKPDIPKDKKRDGDESWKSTGHDGKYPPRSSQSDAKPILPKTQSQSKIKKATNNKKSVKSQSSFEKSKPKNKKSDK
jgi:hypothetical protein